MIRHGWPTHLIAYALALCTGCNTADENTSAADSADSTTTSPTAGMTDTTTAGGRQGCECADEQGVAGWLSKACDPEPPLCGMDAAAVSSCFADVDGPCSGFEAADEEQVTCMLTALRDRTPGSVTLLLSGTLRSEYHGLLINSDGTAVKTTNTERDGMCIEEGIELGTLAAPAVYDACLANTDFKDRVRCLATPLESVIEVCIEGKQFDCGDDGTGGGTG